MFSPKSWMPLVSPALVWLGDQTMNQCDYHRKVKASCCRKLVTLRCILPLHGTGLHKLYDFPRRSETEHHHFMYAEGREEPVSTNKTPQ